MRSVLSALLIAVVAGCADDVPVTQPQMMLAGHAPKVTYRIDKLPTLGKNSQGGGINERGWVGGYSGLLDGSRHAALWRNGSILDLGTLGGIAGLNSNVQWPGLNNEGTVVGISQTAALDTLGETWSCAAFIAPTGHVCLGFVWEHGAMAALPTLGGENGFAAGVNDRGEVVGWAETAVHDPTCRTPQVLQFRAVVWEHEGRFKHQLRPFPGDSTSAATAINERGQVVGISGECDVAVGRRSATHAVMWDGHRIINLGSLGGDFWHTPMAINNRGDVVGFSNPPDGDIDADSLRAFLWTRGGGMQDLGKFTGDAFSQALGINDRGQIVGVSCGAVCNAVLWQDGKMIRLQDLVDPAIPDLLWSARSINAAGVITGRLIEAGTGKAFAFVATPVRDEH
jgi:probable HAF family extracellular repeat protein